MDERLRLFSGLDVLDRWSAAAGPGDRETLYTALFAVADGSSKLSFDVRGVLRCPDQLQVRIGDDLVLRVRLSPPDLFEVVYIGPVPPAEAA